MRLALSFALASIALSACGADERPLPDLPIVDDEPTLSCGAPPLVPSEALVYGSEGGACARVERVDRSEPDMVYKAIPYDALRVAVVVDDVAVDVDVVSDVGPGALTYTSTHHNWADEATAISGDRIARVTMHYVIDVGIVLEAVILDATLDDVAREEAPLAGPVSFERW